MKLTIAFASLLAISAAARAQEGNPTQHRLEQPGDGSTPLYRVNVVARTTQAVNYGHRSDQTKIDFAGALLEPHAKGEARIAGNRGAVAVNAKFKKLPPPQRFGVEYLTYVLWAITPDGRATNLGELVTDTSDKAKLDTATELQTFALVVTAEPYYAVTHPSDVVVMENVVRPDTVGSIQTVDAKYELLKRGQFTFDLDAAKAQMTSQSDRMVSQKEYEALLGLYQAKHAVQLAEANGAAEHAADSKNRNVVTLAREATQTAEDARLIAARKGS